MRRVLRIAAVALTAIVATCSAQGMAEQDMAGQVTGSTGECNMKHIPGRLCLYFVTPPITS
jgi:hypothetical protein